MNAVRSEQVGSIKLAELTSTLGAGVLGAGLGGLIRARVDTRAWIVVAALGLMAHATGMLFKGQIERAALQPMPKWSRALVVLCWSQCLSRWQRNYYRSSATSPA